MTASPVFEVQNGARSTVVRFFGHVDAGIVEQAKPALKAAIPASCPRLVVDLSQVDFLDSHGVGLFVSLLKTMHRNKGRLVFAGAAGQPSSVLHMVGFNGDFVTWCSTVEEATAETGAG